jgi:hypothetical protein
VSAGLSRTQHFVAKDYLLAKLHVQVGARRVFASRTCPLFVNYLRLLLLRMGCCICGRLAYSDGTNATLTREYAGSPD